MQRIMCELSLVKVGWVNDAHGLKGELYVRLKADRADWLEVCEELWLKPHQIEQPQAFKLNWAKPHRDGLIVNLVGLADRTQAELWKRAEVLVDADLLEGDLETGLYLGQYLGTQVFDPEGQSLGRVVGLGSNGPQDLLVIENACGRFEVPLVSEFLREVNLEEGRVVMDLPEGLVERP